MKTAQKHFKNNENNEKVWLEDFDPYTVFPLTRARARLRRQELLASTRGSTTGHYNGERLARGLRPKNKEAQRGDTTGRHNGSKTKNVTFIISILLQKLISIHKLCPQPALKHPVGHFQGIAMKFWKFFFSIFFWSKYVEKTDFYP